MRTNIEIDDGLLKEAADILGVKTKRETVEAALQHVVRETRLRRALEEMRGLGWEGDLDAMRCGRGPD